MESTRQKFRKLAISSAKFIGTNLVTAVQRAVFGAALTSATAFSASVVDAAINSIKEDGVCADSLASQVGDSLGTTAEALYHAAASAFEPVDSAKEQN